MWDCCLRDSDGFTQANTHTHTLDKADTGGYTAETETSSQVCKRTKEVLTALHQEHIRSPMKTDVKKQKQKKTRD